ncbi:ABC transporter ATP-binding protein [Methyloceanibacter superfactus]|jgi:branched-chain amino acid transport system ATP-binding protein|uniref:ABC transporter ATP-binding protein n=1 Tax=Methyloceanibacter superfactus TaxID=1774969 RepID=A0A1E3W648_9HYPH|nr:ABC transporter ATP-binding protein [Methyloceanibacter superfactus]ODS01283.1 ABC transporter ATP-binding protein [Methyloceanibacter superfactus]
MKPTEQPILQVRDLGRLFGGIVAVNDLSLDVRAGSIHGLIGPNGAGKTTTFNVISGFYPPSRGKVIYFGQDISGRATSALAELGLIRTFQGTTLFHELSVLDNVRLGCHRSAKASLISRVLGTDRATEDAAEEKARGILKFLELDRLADEITSNLSHGHQRALGMAVALAADPKLMLLDEPFTGMNPEETRRMIELVKLVREEQGVTIMLIEHDMQAVMGLCDIITVMNFGSLLAEGTPEEVRNNPTVIEAYLGSAVDAA